MIELWHQTAFRNAFLVRGAAAWVIVRVFMGSARTSDPNLVGEALVLLIVGALVAGDARRRNEDLFLANLGVPWWAIVVLGALGALPLEFLVPVSTAAPILEADGIGRSFKGRTVLNSAGLRVRPGRITALLGRNGVGKSTLFRIAVGRVRAEYGRVMFAGEYRPRPSLARLSREGLMYSAQESALTPHFTVREHFKAFVTRYGGGDRVDTLIEESSLGDVLDRGPRSLSGGERQRASMALARLRSPACLIADEPFAGVAPKDRPLIAVALRSLASEGCGIAVSGHDVEDLLALADEVVWMVAGTTHDLGPPEQAARHHQFRRDYLGPRGDNP